MTAPGHPEVVIADDGNRSRMVAELAGRPIAVDVETVGTDPWSAGSRLRMVQMAAVPGRVWIDMQPGAAVRDVVLAAPAIIGHNVTFDLLWLHRLGLVDLDCALASAVDTMVLAHLKDNRVRTPPATVVDDWDEAQDYAPVDGTAPGHALKDLAGHYLGPNADEAERRLSTAHHLPSRGSASFAAAWAAIPDDDALLIAYAAADVDLTLRLLPHLKPRVGEAGVVAVERRASAVAARMMARGFIIDEERVDAARTFCRQEQAATRPALVAAGITSIAATGRGRDQAEAALLAAGVPLTKRTESGAYSLDREVLEGLAARGCVLAGMLHRARRADRFQRDYLRKMLDNRGLDGRLRPSIRTVGARTGRWTVGGSLPMQQMPRKGGFRECFAAEDGHVLVTADYSSIEFHTLGRVTGDEAMLSVTWSGADPYLAGGRVIWPDAPFGTEAERQAIRSAGKPFVLGLGYGMGAATLAAKSGRSFDEARRSLDRLRSAWPGPSRAMATLRRQHALGEPMLTNPFGRKLVIPSREDGTAIAHAALNHLNQGTARDLMVRDLLAIEDAGLVPWLTLHDEVTVECDKADEEEALRVLLGAMNHAEHPVLGIPIRANGGVLGPCWGKL